MRGFFVTGTDTEVGKTVISSGLAALMREHNRDVGVFKPFLSGISRHHPESDTSILKETSQTSLSHEDITPFAFKAPLAPYVAGKLEGKAVTMEEVLSHWERIRETHECFIAEGAGGISVPLGEGFLVSDVIKALQLPMVIVARPHLGTINHTFLTVQYAKNMGLPIAGIVINGISDSLHDDEKTNPEMIERLCGVPILGITPKLVNVTKETVLQMVKDHINLSLLMNQVGV
ncbi:ATP-dependent dethiobiotin synthetase BioD [Bacillus vallismortis]|uniref:dethiobiotin synthase n=1 Tax=Bacillus TaxID=1386 RepID=UPI00057C2683|nr:MULTISPECIES: dethiobiotin synthase [Bacillus]PJZ00180.1 ATP-dependent dethiobiotin synthetase BioD [Bacillus vallismortis]